jgi:hypothetical protein
MTNALVISAISLSISIFCVFFFPWYIARKTAAGRLLSDYRTEVNRLIADIDAATDRDSQLVEARIKTLRSLLEDTDRRIAVYLREIQRSKAGEALYTSLGRGIQAALDSRPAETIAAAETKNPPEGNPYGVPEGKPEGTPEAAPATAPAPAKKRAGKKRRSVPIEQNSPQPAKLNTRAQIAQMSAQGLSPAEIASGMGISLAEVDLALNLLVSMRH